MCGDNTYAGTSCVDAAALRGYRSPTHGWRLYGFAITSHRVPAGVPGYPCATRHATIVPLTSHPAIIPLSSHPMIIPLSSHDGLAHPTIGRLGWVPLSSHSGVPLLPQGTAASHFRYLVGWSPMIIPLRSHERAGGCTRCHCRPTMVPRTSHEHGTESSLSHL